MLRSSATPRRPAALSPRPQPRCRRSIAALGFTLLLAAAVPRAAAVEPPTPLPDLSVGGTAFAPTAVAPGGSLAISGRLLNRGTSAAVASLAIRVDDRAGYPIVLGSRRFVVQPGGRHPFSIELPIPEAVDQGSYELSVCVRRRGLRGRLRCRSAGPRLVIAATAPPRDRDRDHVSDIYDGCPATPGSHRWGGCVEPPPPPPDGDRDGVIDDGDRCPSDAGNGLYQGCAEPPLPAPGYHAGALSLGDRLFPEVGNGGYDVLHYDVNLDYDNLDNSFGAATYTELTALAIENLSSFSLDLEGLEVAGVTVNGEPATFRRIAPARCALATGENQSCPISKLVITPATRLDTGRQFVVRIDYDGSPLRLHDADGTDEGWLATPNGDGAFVVNEPVGAMTWVPCNNHPLDKASWEFHLTVPAGKTALGNGEQSAPPSPGPGPTTTWHWSEQVPMASYLATATVGDFDLTESLGADGLQLYNAIDSSVGLAERGSFQRSTAREEEVIGFEAAHFGPYPFASAGVVADLADSSYVLEVQTKIHFPSHRISILTLAHEFAHQWFGDSVSPTGWDQIWQNEGWATFAAWYFSYHANRGAISPEQQFTDNYTPGSKWRTAPTDPDPAGLFATFPVYTRGAMMLEALREIVGNDRFFAIARRWASDYRYGNATTAQLIAVATAESGFDGARRAKLERFFRQWLQIGAMPTITGANFNRPGSIRPHRAGVRAVRLGAQTVVGSAASPLEPPTPRRSRRYDQMRSN